MASIVDLVRPGRPSIPKPSPSSVRPSMRPGIAPPVGKRLHPARLCARYARGRGAADYRYGATGHQGSKGACQRRGSFSCCELSA